MVVVENGIGENLVKRNYHQPPFLSFSHYSRSPLSGKYGRLCMRVYLSKSTHYLDPIFQDCSICNSMYISPDSGTIASKSVPITTKMYHRLHCNYRLLPKHKHRGLPSRFCFPNQFSSHFIKRTTLVFVPPGVQIHFIIHNQWSF